MTNLTTNTETRWTWLGSIIAAVLVIGFVGLVIASALGVASLGAIPQAWFLLFSTLVVTAAVWVFGKESLVKYWERQNG